MNTFEDVGGRGCLSQNEDVWGRGGRDVWAKMRTLNYVRNYRIKEFYFYDSSDSIFWDHSRTSIVYRLRLLHCLSVWWSADSVYSVFGCCRLQDGIAVDFGVVSRWRCVRDFGEVCPEHGFELCHSVSLVYIYRERFLQFGWF